jgi:hypothetical protein
MCQLSGKFDTVTLEGLVQGSLRSIPCGQPHPLACQLGWEWPLATNRVAADSLKLFLSSIYILRHSIFPEHEHITDHNC